MRQFRLLQHPPLPTPTKSLDVLIFCFCVRKQNLVLNSPSVLCHALHEEGWHQHPYILCALWKMQKSVRSTRAPGIVPCPLLFPALCAWLSDATFSSPSRTLLLGLVSMALYDWSPPHLVLCLWLMRTFRMVVRPLQHLNSPQMISKWQFTIPWLRTPQGCLSLRLGL